MEWQAVIYGCASRRRRHPARRPETIAPPAAPPARTTRRGRAGPLASDSPSARTTLPSRRSCASSRVSSTRTVSAGARVPRGRPYLIMRARPRRSLRRRQDLPRHPAEQLDAGVRRHLCADVHPGAAPAGAAERRDAPCGHWERGRRGRRCGPPDALTAAPAVPAVRPQPRLARQHGGGAAVCGEPCHVQSAGAGVRRAELDRKMKAGVSCGTCLGRLGESSDWPLVRSNVVACMTKATHATRLSSAYGCHTFSLPLVPNVATKLR